MEVITDHTLPYTGCKHLDYADNYPSCNLIRVENDANDKSKAWQWWERQNVPYEGAPVKVQFCSKRGRINEIFACINKGEMQCYEEQEGD